MTTPDARDDVIWHCQLGCDDPIVGMAASLDHLRLMHPDEFGDGPQRWPDGALVLADDTLKPEDFS